MGLGRMKRINDLRTVWPHEANDFTKWLAEEAITSLSTNLQPKLQQELSTMTGIQVKGILEQIEAGKKNRRHVYQCCENCFETLYEFRKHLFVEHPEEMKLYFEAALTGGNVVKPTAEEVHKMARKGRNVKEKALKKKEERKVRMHNQDAYPTPSKGDYFRLVYTPMGNKK